MDYLSCQISYHCVSLTLWSILPLGASSHEDASNLAMHGGIYILNLQECTQVRVDYSLVLFISTSGSLCISPLSSSMNCDAKTGHVRTALEPKPPKCQIPWYFWLSPMSGCWSWTAGLTPASSLIISKGEEQSRLNSFTNFTLKSCCPASPLKQQSFNL